MTERKSSGTRASGISCIFWLGKRIAVSHSKGKRSTSERQRLPCLLADWYKQRRISELVVVDHSKQGYQSQQVPMTRRSLIKLSKRVCWPLACNPIPAPYVCKNSVIALERT